jgi:hypothetical protein
MENPNEQVPSNQSQIKSELDLATNTQVNMSEKVGDPSNLKLPASLYQNLYKNLYSEALRAELIELQSDTDFLFQQLQSLSRLSQVGSFS